MAVYQLKSCSLHEAGCLSWSSVYPRKFQKVRSNAYNGLYLPARVRVSFLLPHFLSRLPAEGVAQITGGSFHLRRSGIKVGLHLK